MAFDRDGNMLIADSMNHRIRRVDASGTITTIAGTGEAGLSGDGGPATAARLNLPIGIAADEHRELLDPNAGNRLRWVHGAGWVGAEP